MNKSTQLELISRINSGQVGVMATDTVYGIVASVKFPEKIEYTYEITGRPKHKPYIVLVSDFSQLDDLGIELSLPQKKSLKDVWPGAVSVILDSDSSEVQHIHRGKYSIAVRLPNSDWLKNVINETGPIIATSANLSGQPTSDNLEKIKSDLPQLDFYFEGQVTDSPSKLAKVTVDGKLSWIAR